MGSPFTVAVTATDPQGATATASYVLNVVPAPNQAPVLTGTPLTSPQSATVGIAYSTTTAAAFSDPDGGPLTYSASPLPAGVSINPGTGVISGTPSSTVGSPFTVAVTATDPQGSSVSTNFTLAINPAGPPVNNSCGSGSLDGTPLRATAPVFDCATITTTGAIQFKAAGGMASGGAVEFKAIGVTDWTTNCNMTIDRETRTACDAAPIEIQIRQLVNGSYVYGTSYVFNIRQQCPVQGCGTIQPGNRPPVVNAGIPDQTTKVGATFDYDVPKNAFSDPDGDELLYTSSQLPSSFTFSSGHFHGLPQTATTIPVTVTAYDNNGGTVSTSFNIIVRPADSTEPPVNNTCGSSSLDGTPLRATAPVFDCATITTTGAIQFKAAGGMASGGAVEFKAIGVTDWTTNCNMTIDRETRTACDAAPIEIQIRQLVNGSYVYGTSYVFNIRQQCPIQGCNAPARQAASEERMPLDVRVLGNPVQGETVNVEVYGAEGKTLRLIMTDTRGHSVSEQTIENASANERQTVRLGRTAGLYLLRVSTPTQTKTVKVVKQ